MKLSFLFILVFCLNSLCYSQGIYDLRSPGAWKLASIPAKQPELFPESSLQNNLATGYNRAKLAWYVIDPIVFYRETSINPPNLNADLTNHLSREVFESEVYPNIHLQNGLPTSCSIWHLSFYPSEKGPYNFDVDSCQYTDGIDSFGRLNSPEKRWGGIMRTLEENTFRYNTFNYLGFLLMDPFVYNSNHSGGDLYFDIGDISEDVLKDNFPSFENFYFPSPILPSSWGNIYELTLGYNAFTNTEDQDIGLDLLDNLYERIFFTDYLTKVRNKFGINSVASNLATNDPSSDDYHLYRGTDYDNQGLGIHDRYKYYNCMDGNSTPYNLSPENYPTAATTSPDNEDINNNGILDTLENYFQYKVELKPEKMIVGQNFITDKITVNPINGDGSPVTWYKFMIPLNTDQKEIIGNINSLESASFIRIFLHGFSESVILRFYSLVLTPKDLPYSHETSSDCNIPIFPNPSNGSFIIDNFNHKLNSIKVYDFLGRDIILTDNINLNPYCPTINLSSQPNGIYIVKIETDKNTCIQKLLIEK